MKAVKKGSGSLPLEPLLRLLTAKQLGVDAGDLTPEVSLTDELGADSLDLAELAMVLEDEFGVELPTYEVDAVRTYGDLTSLVMSAMEHVPAPQAEEIPYGATVVASLVPPAGRPGVDRVEVLTPYVMQLIGEDAAVAGRGARLEVSMPPGTDAGGIEAISRRLAWLGQHGVDVSVRPAPATGVAAQR